MKYILVSKNAKIVLTEEEKKKFVHNYENSKSQLLPVKGQLVDRFGLEVLEFDFFLKQEADKLKFRDLRRCRHCAEILPRNSVCKCKDKPELKGTGIFAETNNNQLPDGSR